jgi:hypothetical protein
MKHEKELNKSSPSNDNGVGLSSAMHDIRTLKSHYLEHDAALESPLSIPAQSPLVLIEPTSAAKDPTKPLAITAIVLGLCVSALAMMQMRMTADRGLSQERSLVLPATQTTLQSATILPSEPPLYISETEVTAPISELRQRHTAAPPVKAMRKAKPSQVSEAKVEAPQCDEILCLVEPDAACCLPSPAAESEESFAEARPVRQSRREVMQRMRSLNGRVQSCFDEAGIRGVVTVEFVILADGSTSDVRVPGQPSEMQACIAPLMESLHFEPAQTRLSMAYPYVFR